MYQRPRDEGNILIRMVPIGLFEERNGHEGHKEGAAWIRLALATYKQEIEDELRRWLAEEAPYFWPSVNKEAKKQSAEYLNNLVKPLIDYITKVAELEGGRRINYIKWLVVRRIRDGFVYDHGGIIGIALERSTMMLWLSKHGHRLTPPG